MIRFEIPYPAGRAGMSAWNKRYSLNAYWSGKHYQARRRDAEELAYRRRPEGGDSNA